jgi:hypothetical protein
MSAVASVGVCIALPGDVEAAIGGRKKKQVVYSVRVVTVLVRKKKQGSFPLKKSEPLIFRGY